MCPYRRCSCDRQHVPRRRARIGGLCGFPSAVERVPAKYQKTGRCANVRECPAELQRRSRSVCGRLSAEGEAAIGERASRRKGLALFCASPSTSAHSAGSFRR